MIKIDPNYTYRFINWSVRDWAYKEQSIEKDSFKCTNSYDENRKLIIIKVDYKVLPFDYSTTQMIHEEMRARVLSCALDYSNYNKSCLEVYQDGNKLELTMPGYFETFYSTSAIKSKYDYFNRNSSQFNAWRNERLKSIKGK